MAAAGYSGTPLARKLSLKPGMTAWFHEMSETVRVDIGDIEMVVLPGPIRDLDVAHIFTRERAGLGHLLQELR